MIIEFDNFVCYAHHVTALNVTERKVYLSCGSSLQLNEDNFQKIRNALKEKYEVPQVVRDKPVSTGNTANKPKRISK